MSSDVPVQPDSKERPYFQPLFKPVHFGDSISDKEKVSSLSWRSELKRRLPYRPHCRSKLNVSFQNCHPFRRWPRVPHPSSSRTQEQKAHQTAGFHIDQNRGPERPYPAV